MYRFIFQDNDVLYFISASPLIETADPLIFVNRSISSKHVLFILLLDFTRKMPTHNIIFIVQVDQVY